MQKKFIFLMACVMLFNTNSYALPKMVGVEKTDAQIEMELDIEIARLQSEFNREYRRLETCAKKKNGFAIAGISTMALAGGGVALNVAQANKGKKLEADIAAQNKAQTEHRTRIAQEEADAEKARLVEEKRLEEEESEAVRLYKQQEKQCEEVRLNCTGEVYNHYSYEDEKWICSCQEDEDNNDNDEDEEVEEQVPDNSGDSKPNAENAPCPINRGTKFVVNFGEEYSVNVNDTVRGIATNVYACKTSGTTAVWVRTTCLTGFKETGKADGCEKVQKPDEVPEKTEKTENINTNPITIKPQSPNGFEIVERFRNNPTPVVNNCPESCPCTAVGQQAFCTIDGKRVGGVCYNKNNKLCVDFVNPFVGTPSAKPVAPTPQPSVITSGPSRGVARTDCRADGGIASFEKFGILECSKNIGQGSLSCGDALSDFKSKTGATCKVGGVVNQDCVCTAITTD